MDIELDDIDRYSIQIINMLRKGAIMVYPTETVVGIGCVGDNERSVKRIFELKKRDLSKPVSYAFASVEQVAKYAVITDRIKPLLELLPGPLTLVLELRDDAPELYGLADRTIGVRIPDVTWLRHIIAEVGPVISTSANISSVEPARSVEAIPFTDEVDILIRWKGVLNGLSSTVLSCVEPMRILRSGAISSDKIFSLIK